MPTEAKKTQAHLVGSKSQEAPKSQTDKKGII